MDKELLALEWHIEWGHDYNMLVDSGFYPSQGPFGMEAMFRYLKSQGWAYVSATYVGSY
jgi:hypothetical protein